MKRLLRCLLVVLLVVECDASAQSKTDEAAVRNVPQAFAAAWATHDDGRQLGKIMSEDVDFVNVAAEWLHGRSDFVLFHRRLLSGRFKESTLTPLEISVRFLKPDQAVLHWNWRLEGDRNQDLTLRKPRLGLFTMIVEKSAQSESFEATNLAAKQSVYRTGYSITPTASPPPSDKQSVA